MQAHNLFRADPVPVEHFTLFSSLLGKDQPVYTPEVQHRSGSGAILGAPVRLCRTHQQPFAKHAELRRPRGRIGVHHIGVEP